MLNFMVLTHASLNIDQPLNGDRFITSLKKIHCMVIRGTYVHLKLFVENSCTKDGSESKFS